MKLTTLAALSIGALAALPHSEAPWAGQTQGIDGLIQIRSRYLDELYLRPGADLRSYRAVVIEPVQITMHEDWLNDMNDGRGASRRVGPEDARRVSEEAAASLQGIVTEAYRAKGYEVAGTPGPRVLRLSPKVSQLYVNALDARAPGTARTYTREAGEATLILEARDSVTGKLLARVAHRERPASTGGFSRSSDVSTRFWFDAFFSRWAANCAGEFVAARNPPPASRAP